MKLRIKSNNCKGWHQPIAILNDGTERKGARWPTYKEAYNALIKFHRTGKFPSEEVEEEIKLCSECGQPMQLKENK